MINQEVLEVEVLVAADDPVALENLRRYAVASVINSCRNVRGGTVVLRLSGEDGRFLGLNVVGTPNEEMQERIEELFGSEGEGPNPAA